MFNELFVEIGAVVVLAGALSFIAHKLRQPLIVAYIITGLVVGPSVLGIAKSEEVFAAMSEVGIAFLLFIVGLNLNWKHIREVGRVALLGGLSQVLFTSLAGYAIGRLVGLDPGTAAFAGVAFSFSSTIIIVKLLSDKEDLERLYGRIAVGMLIVQDLIAMFLLLIVAALRDGGAIADVLTVSFGKGIVVVGVLAFLSHFVLPRVFRYAAQSQELIFLTALAWCFGLAATLHIVGFGIEIGALLAGISLAGSGYQLDIEAKIRSLRDFFLVIFFIVLGMHLELGAIAAAIVPALCLSAYVLVGNPLIAMLIMRFMGYHPRAAFLTGTTVAQVSEFSFILLAGGIAAGLVTDKVMPIATLVALITITLSTYLIQYNDRIYDTFDWAFKWMEGKHHKGEGRKSKAPDHLLLGYNRMGKRILPKLQEMGGETLVVECNPAVIQELADATIPHMYGDAGSEDVLHFLHAEKARMIVSTIPDMSVSLDVLEYLRSKRSKAVVVVTVRASEEAVVCYNMGASYVIIPSVLGGEAFGEHLMSRKLKKTSWQALARKQGHHKLQ